jgi:hypothetical protein
MKRTLMTVGTLCALVMASTLGLAGQAEEAVQPKEKITLFDGESFDGWVRHLRGGKGDPDKTWTIKDGVLACSGRPAGYIRTEKAYKNYHLRLEYRWPANPGNNGVLVHMVGDDRVWPKSLECQGRFHNQGVFWEIGGWKFNEHKTGGHRVRGRRVEKYGEHNEKPRGEWNVYEVWAVGDVVRPYVNGKLMNEATGCETTAGKICFQSEGAPIEFRNITIAPATDKPWPVTPTKKVELFNGKDLSGWVRFIPNEKKVDGKWQSDIVWSVTDGVIHCIGKPNGYIRTVEDYENYKLHVEWRWAAKPTNSGVLLHKQGIDRVWPKCVEAQLMHEHAGDFWLLGGGSIEADGKRVGGKKNECAPKDGGSNEKPVGEWNSYDIVCDGGTVTLTVNGKQMNQGTDADPSSGKILLQSEGSPIEFRNVYLEPLEK